MKTLGILGGTGRKSKALACRLLNQGVAAQAGGVRSAPRLHSLDFAPIPAAQADADSPLSLFHTSYLHAAAAVDWTCS